MDTYQDVPRPFRGLIQRHETLAVDFFRGTCIRCGKRRLLLTGGGDALCAQCCREKDQAHESPSLHGRAVGPRPRAAALG